MNTASPILYPLLRLGVALMIAAVLTACGAEQDDDGADAAQSSPPQLRCAP